MIKSNYIYEFCEGKGELFESYDPGKMESLGLFQEASTDQLREAFLCCKSALSTWKETTLDKRIEILQKYKTNIIQSKEELSEIISKETGKTLWESKQEVSAMIGKIRFVRNRN